MHSFRVREHFLRVKIHPNSLVIRRNLLAALIFLVLVRKCLVEGRHSLI